MDIKADNNIHWSKQTSQSPSCRRKVWGSERQAITAHVRSQATANKPELRCLEFPFHAFKSWCNKTKGILWKYDEIVLHKFKYTLNTAVWENN